MEYFIDDGEKIISKILCDSLSTSLSRSGSIISLLSNVHEPTQSRIIENVLAAAILLFGELAQASRIANQLYHWQIKINSRESEAQDLITHLKDLVQSQRRIIDQSSSKPQTFSVESSTEPDLHEFCQNCDRYRGEALSLASQLQRVKSVSEITTNKLQVLCSIFILRNHI